MHIKLLDQVVEKEALQVEKAYPVIRTEMVRDDLYYLVLNDIGKEVPVHELLAEEL